MSFDRSPRLSNQVIGVLLSEVAQEWEPGSLLPRESDLASRFGISRGVTREVLRGLEIRGVVTVRHGHGAIVNDPRQWNILDADVLAAILQAKEGFKSLSEVLECRRILEVQAASLAAERATRSDLADIASALEDMRSHADSPDEGGDEYLEADLRFHEALAAATDNRALFQISELLGRAFVTAHRPLAHPDARRERSVPEHEQVYLAVSRGDADAAGRAMTQLLQTVEGYLDDLKR